MSRYISKAILYSLLPLLWLLTASFDTSGWKDTPIDPDSIRVILQTASDSEKVVLLLRFASEYNNINPDQAIEYAEMAQRLARDQRSKHLQADAGIIMGRAYYIKGQYEEAIAVTEKMEVLVGSIADSLRLVGVYQNYSLIFTKLGDFKKALDYSMDAFNLLAKFNQPNKLADLVREIGNIYFAFGEETIALDYYQKSLAICKENDNQIGISKALNNIGRIYSELGQHNKAIGYLEQSLEIKYKHDNKLGIANTLLNIGTNYHKQKNYDQAIRHFIPANRFYAIVGFSEGVSNSYQYLGNTYLKTGSYQLAEESFQKAHDIAAHDGNKPLLVTIIFGQSELFAATGRYKLAWETLLRHNELRDSIFGDEKRKLLVELDARYRVQAKERQIQLLSKDTELKDLQRKKLFFWMAFLIVTALLLISFTYFIYSRMRLKNRINRQLIDEITQRKTIQEELKTHQDHLEALIEDRTMDLKVARDKAEESDMLKTAFLANMSHEIRTPMNAVIGFSNLLLEAETSDPDRAEFAQLIRSNGEILMNLINDIIDISMIESGQVKVNQATVSIPEIIEELRYHFEKIKQQMNKGHLAIVADWDSALSNITINTDKNRLRQVLNNLLSNALKFTDKGVVTIGFRKNDEGTLLFYIRDTGIGIPADKHEVIFDRFNKFNALDESRLYSGTGLGLAISRELVSLLGGNIWLDSSPGKGSTFYFTLPCSKENVPCARQEEKQPHEGSFSINLRGRTILVAEDVISNFQLIKAYLNRTNATLIWAKNGEEAVALFRSTHGIDLVLMDLQMPILDGFKAAEMIREVDKDVPIIAQTAFAFANEMDNCYAAGCNDYVTKPIKKEELLYKISTYLQGVT